jgi:hypothetical protein
VIAEWRKLHCQILHIFLFTKYCEEGKEGKLNEEKDKSIQNYDRKNRGRKRDVNSKIILK